MARGLGILFWIALWFVIAALVGNDLLLAGPIDTAYALLMSFTKLSFWQAVGNTSFRIIVTSVLSAIAGICLGALSYKFKWVREFLFAPLQIMKSAPVACVIVIVLVAWGSLGALITIVAFVALPPFYVAMIQALESRPRQAETVLRLAGVGDVRIFASCIWPSILPFFIAASKTSVALSWRAGITAELLCLPMASLGSAVYTSKLTLDSAELLALTIVVMALSWLCEKAVVILLDLSGKLGHLSLAKSHERKVCETQCNMQHCYQEPDSQFNNSITLEEVNKRFGDNNVLNDFSIEVQSGDRICLMAPTGSGKSTVIKIMLATTQPDSGRVLTSERLGVMLQSASLVEALNAYENILIAAGPCVSRADIDRAMDALLSEGACDKKPAELSGGMKRLVELMRAMFSDGQAIVLDEPFAGLDAESHRRACAFILENLHGRPLVVATHDSDDISLLDAHKINM